MDLTIPMFIVELCKVTGSLPYDVETAQQQCYRRYTKCMIEQKKSFEQCVVDTNVDYVKVEK